ncbi:MAG: sugar phosphate isomerase/epimerase family protein [Bryobacteraceae bacterium]|nr:sugar phosphate isomerase/epimerase family protein [Bryobacteraceae bacterium]
MPRPQLCLFSKHAAHLNWKELGAFVKKTGFDGVDLTVRDKGHVEPANAARDLEPAVEAIRAAGASVPMITTGLLTGEDDYAGPILSNAGRLKIPFFKPGYHKYRDGEGIEAKLAALKPKIASLAAAGRSHGVAMGFHNHSGDHVGLAVWDIRELIANHDPSYSGYYWDTAHSVIEGTLYGWKASLDLVLPRLKMIAVKDFFWERKDEGWKLQWCPLGGGMVDFRAIFKTLAQAGWSGPVSLHTEYATPDEMRAIEADFRFLKREVDRAYGG